MPPQFSKDQQDPGHSPGGEFPHKFDMRAQGSRTGAFLFTGGDHEPNSLVTGCYGIFGRNYVGDRDVCARRAGSRGRGAGSSVRARHHPAKAVFQL